MVLGGLGQAVELGRIRLERQSPGAQPAPGTGQRGFHLDGHSLRGQILQCSKRHHRLVEGQADERCNRDFAFRGKTQYLQRAGLKRSRGGIGLLGWKAILDSETRPRRRQAFNRSVENKLVKRQAGQSRQTRQQLGKLIRREWFAGGNWLRLGSLKLGLSFTQFNLHRVTWSFLKTARIRAGSLALGIVQCAGKRCDRTQGCKSGRVKFE